MHRSQPVLDLCWQHCQPFHHLNPSSAASSYIVFSPVDSPRKINKSRVKSVLPLARSHCAVLKILLDPLGVFWLAQLEKKTRKPRARLIATMIRIDVFLARGAQTRGAPLMDLEICLPSPNLFRLRVLFFRRFVRSRGK